MASQQQKSKKVEQLRFQNTFLGIRNVVLFFTSILYIFLFLLAFLLFCFLRKNKERRGDKIRYRDVITTDALTINTKAITNCFCDFALHK
jgi:hypothetical protein